MRLSIDMRGKIRFSRWLMAATVLTVAEYDQGCADRNRLACCRASTDLWRFISGSVCRVGGLTNIFKIYSRSTNWGRLHRAAQTNDNSLAPPA